jgi:hypothetical protein
VVYNTLLLTDLLCAIVRHDIQLVSREPASVASCSRHHLELCVALAQCNPKLIEWLLQQQSTAEFNNKLEVNRCTDEPRLLGAIASLQYVRTALLHVLYPETPYGNLSQVLQAVQRLQFTNSNTGNPFADNGDSNNTVAAAQLLQSIDSVSTAFDGIMAPFLKEELSRAQQALADVKLFATRGSFVLRGGCSDTDALCLETVDSSMCRGQQQICLEAKLQDLRAKLLLTELADAPEATQLVSALDAHMQILTEAKHRVQQLQAAGHPDFQERGSGYVLHRPFAVLEEGLGVDDLLFEVKCLSRHLVTWDQEMFALRQNSPWLDCFTIKFSDSAYRCYKIYSCAFCIRLHYTLRLCRMH